MQEARGEFIAFLDSDDRWLPDKLTHQMPGFSDPEVGVSYTGCIIEHVGFGKGSAFVRRLREGETTGDIVEYLTYMNVMGGAFSQVVRRELIDKVGGFNIDPFLIPFAEDWEYWIRLCSHTKVAYIAEPLVVHRIHDQNTEQPVGPNTYGRMIIKVLSYSGRKGAALTIRAARRRYRLMNAEALHVNNWGAFVMAYLWAIRVTGWGFAWEDVRTLLWRARGGRARLKKAQDHHSVQNPPEAERGPSTRRSGDRQQKENIP
jgi:glycosyltransferase involved in cell wall biosynthesis